MKINAVAGSGKTTTVIEYAKARSKTSKILYLAFNKSVRHETKKRFANLGLHNVQVETAHSLAYKHQGYFPAFQTVARSNTITNKKAGTGRIVWLKSAGAEVFFFPSVFFPFFILKSTK